jgi:hypothetical protein
MPKSIIKEEFKSTLVVFNGGGQKLLGEREDIDVLAVMALESQNRNLINLFEYLPSLEELKSAQFETQIKKNDAVAIKRKVERKVEPK